MRVHVCGVHMCGKCMHVCECAQVYVMRGECGGCVCTRALIHRVHRLPILSHPTSGSLGGANIHLPAGWERVSPIT